MTTPRKPWYEELAIIDHTMKAISGLSDPEDVVDKYWEGIGQIVKYEHYLAVSRRELEYPNYIITRSSRFTEHPNPWTQRDRLPKLSGGIIADLLYANAPSFIENLPAVLKADDPAHHYLQGFKAVFVLPNYENNESLNLSFYLFGEEDEIDTSLFPTLMWQSNLFGRGTQNLVLKNQLAAAAKLLDRELHVVGQIQQTLLPDNLPSLPGYDFAAHYKTSARAGGDYYDFFPQPDGRLGIMIADVAGHGTPAAVHMAILRTLANSHKTLQSEPGRFLSFLNVELEREYLRNGTFITAFYAVLDPQKKTLTYSNAGHNPPRLLRSGRIIDINGAASLPLGVLSDAQYGFAQLTFQKGDLLLMYTDGITEAAAPRGPGATIELFGESRLDDVLRTCTCGTSAGVVKCICEAVTAYSMETSPSDDQTLMAMRVV